MEKKWFVHVVGPDDLIEQPDELTALTVANNTNIQAEKDRRDGGPNWPYVIALAKYGTFKEVSRS
jgi:hypothetical protein